MEDKLKEIIYKVSYNGTINFLRYKNYNLERDVYNLISIVFNIDSAFRLGEEVEEVEIAISKETYDNWNIKQIENEIEELIRFVLLKGVKINIVKKSKEKRRVKKKMNFSECDTICLFSGGVDSLSGLLLSQQYYKGNLEAFSVIHGDQGKMGRIIKNLYSKISSTNNLKINYMHAPPMYSKGYSQLRGLFYVLGASIYANLKNSNKILVTECGPTMYQNRFSPYDSITMTTHPFVMSKAKKLMQLFYNKNIEIVIPFENLTKAEVASICLRPELLEFSHSCIGARWIDSKWKQSSDGTCYGCVVRRLGLIVAGIKDATYEKDPIINEDAYSDHISNLLAFSSEFLIDKPNMEDYQLDNIEEFNKNDLFERFALDNIGALHIIKSQGEDLNPKIERFYEETIKKRGIKKVEDRIKEVRTKKYEPDFNKKVI